MVSSDHSPAPDSLKALDSGSFLEAWGGVRGLQYTLPALNTLAQVRSAPPVKCVTSACCMCVQSSCAVAFAC